MTRPTPREAAERLVVLKFVVFYAITAPPREMLKQWLDAWSDQDCKDFAAKAEAERDRYWDLSKKIGVWNNLTLWESEFAQTTIVTMTPRQQIDASWRMEAAGTLMWSLQMVDELPPYDTEASQELLKRIPNEDVETFLESAVLRSDGEIDRMRDVAELWHWRSRTRQLQEEGKDFPFADDEKLRKAGYGSYEDIIRRTAQFAFEQKDIPHPIDEDFPVYGKAYRDLTDHEWAHVQSISIERHFTLNWLCGEAPGNRWDDTPTDT